MFCLQTHEQRKSATAYSLALWTLAHALRPALNRHRSRTLGLVWHCFIVLLLHHCSHTVEYCSMKPVKLEKPSFTSFICFLVSYSTLGAVLQCSTVHHNAALLQQEAEAVPGEAVPKGAVILSRQPPPHRFLLVICPRAHHHNTV